MTIKLGFVGVGHFAGFLMEGFKNKCPDMEIILSPRNKDMALKLADRFGCEIAETNQQVADEADIVIISVRPNIFEDVVSDLNFSENQCVISVASGISIDLITEIVAPAKAIRALPISSAAINQSPTLMIPDDHEIRPFLENLGKVYVMENEDQFTSAAAYSALYGWGFRLLDEAADWGAKNGLQKNEALEILCDVMTGVSAMTEKDSHIPMEKIVESLATKGGITELGLNVMDQKNGFEAWHDALDAVHKRLSGKE